MKKGLLPEAFLAYNETLWTRTCSVRQLAAANTDYSSRK